MSPIEFQRPPGFKRLDEQATVARALGERFRKGEYPSEWEIGDALNQLGRRESGSVANWWLLTYRPRNAQGHAYTEKRCAELAAIAAMFPKDGHRQASVSFSHYEELWRKHLPLELCGYCLGYAARIGGDHKRFRRFIDDVLAAAWIDPDGLTVVPDLERWGTETVAMREVGDAQLTIG